jgi:hypothetical protein
LAKEIKKKKKKSKLTPPPQFFNRTVAMVVICSGMFGKVNSFDIILVEDHQESITPKLGPIWPSGS